jgi:hypothetical protein
VGLLIELFFSGSTFAFPINDIDAVTQSKKQNHSEELIITLVNDVAYWKYQQPLPRWQCLLSKSNTLRMTSPKGSELIKKLFIALKEKQDLPALEGTL